MLYAFPMPMRRKLAHRFTGVLLSSLLPLAGCGAGLDQAEKDVTAQRPLEGPITPARISAGVRLTGFGGFAAKSTSEHFALRRFVIAPLQANGSSGTFDLLPDLLFSRLVEGSESL